MRLYPQPGYFLQRESYNGYIIDYALMRIHASILITFLLIVGIWLLPAPAYGAIPTGNGKLVFKSGFENGVQVDSDLRHLSGSDISGFLWDNFDSSIFTSHRFD